MSTPRNSYPADNWVGLIRFAAEDWPLLDLRVQAGVGVSYVRGVGIQFY
jgi:hypothetical protein